MASSILAVCKTSSAKIKYYKDLALKWTVSIQMWTAIKKDGLNFKWTGSSQNNDLEWKWTVYIGFTLSGYSKFNWMISRFNGLRHFDDRSFQHFWIMVIEIGLKTSLSSFSTSSKLTGLFGSKSANYVILRPATFSLSHFLRVCEQKERVKWVIQTHLDKWLGPSDRLLCTNIDW